jgi:hypothetical protein
VKEFKNDENLPIINKTKNPTKGEKKVQDGRIASPSKLRILQRGQIARGMRRNQVLEPSPLIARSILNKERGGTLKRMPNLDEPSPIIMTHLKIKVVYAWYNAINTLYM